MGSTFTVELPTVAAPGTHTAAVHNGATNHVSLKGVRVLLVEDHADTAVVMAALLRRHHCDVRVAHTIAEAKQFLRDHKDIAKKLEKQIITEAKAVAVKKLDK